MRARQPMQVERDAIREEWEPPLDISEFRCIEVRRSGVVVVFEQTNRRYDFPWRGGELGLTTPEISGPCGPHLPEILDCLARAVAYKAAKSASIAVVTRDTIRLK